MPKLEDYHGKRIRVRGYFDHRGVVNGNGDTVLIQDVTLDGEPLVSHSWVQAAENFRPFAIQRGEQVEFTAVVLQYKKRLDIVPLDGPSYELCFGLNRPHEIKLVERQEPEKEKDMPNNNNKPDEEAQPDLVPFNEPAPRLSKFAKLARVERLAEELGGYDELDKLLSILKG